MTQVTIFLAYAGLTFGLLMLIILFAGYIMRVSGKMLIEHYFQRKAEVFRQLEAELGTATATGFHN